MLRYVILRIYTFVCTGAIIDSGLGREIAFRVYKNVVSFSAQMSYVLRHPSRPQADMAKTHIYHIFT